MEYNNPFIETEIDLREYLHVIYNRRWIIISFCVVVCTLSLICSFMMRPVYMGTTKVLIQKEAPRVMDVEEVSPSDFTSREYYFTQNKILQSRSIAERVSNALGGYVPWSEWTGRKLQRSQDKPLSDNVRIKGLLKRVDIKSVPNTELVEINVEDVDPKLAARISNLWAENYISYTLDSKYDATQYASGWLQEKIKESKVNIEKAELALQEYRKANKEVVDSLEAQTGILEELYKKKAELEVKLSESLEYYKEKHPEIIGLRSEIASVEKRIGLEKDKDLATKDKEIQYNMLKREVESNREMYESLLKRIKETEVTDGIKTTNIRIIDKAAVPERPVKPKKRLNLLIALLIGLAGGAGLAFFFETIDQSVKSPEDVKKYLKIPVLTSIILPQHEGDKSKRPEFITLENPRSPVSEAYKSLRTSIMFTAVEDKRKTLLFTSSLPQEGKTTTAINTAIIMAQAGEKTVLIDADLRNPRIEAVFNISRRNGLSELLAGQTELDAAIHRTEIANLDIIPCGSIPPNPSELLSSGTMDDIIDALDKKYDRIIIDSPPILAVTDAVVLAGKMNGTILVIRAGETPRSAAIHSGEIIGSVTSSCLIGAVLNMAEVDGSKGYYYYHKYYGKYGKKIQQAGNSAELREPVDAQTQ